MALGPQRMPPDLTIPPETAKVYTPMTPPLISYQIHIKGLGSAQLAVRWSHQWLRPEMDYARRGQPPQRRSTKYNVKSPCMP